MKGQRRVIGTIVLIGLICIFIVVLAAYAAELKCTNNMLSGANKGLQGEIGALDVKIKAQNSLDNIEAIAKDKIGMVRAPEADLLSLSDTKEPTGNLAMVIRQNAYE